MKLTMVLPTMDETRCKAVLENWHNTWLEPQQVVLVAQGWQPELPVDECEVVGYTVDHHPSCIGMVAALQRGYELTTDADIIGYTHDDLTIHEREWDAKVKALFEIPNVGVVGFGGALQHGHPDLYRIPYQLQHLARYDYRSNTDDAEMHGTRFIGTCEVAVVDGFAMFIRRKLLERTKGWPTQHLVFHNYDYFIGCSAHRHGYKVLMTGIECFHSGGATSTARPYQEWLESQSLTDQQTHEQAHRWLYKEYSDVLPWRVP